MQHLSTFQVKLFNKKNKLIHDESVFAENINIAYEIAEELKNEIENADSYQVFVLYN